MDRAYLVRITNNGYTETNKLSSERNVSASGSYSVLYWDELSSRDADVRSKGANVMAVSDPRTSGALNTIPVNGQITFSVPVDQQKGDTENDLLVADYIGKQARTSDPVQLTFNHAMTKITVNLIKGDGFSDESFSDAAVTLPAENTSANINLKLANSADNSGAVAGSVPADINMGKLSASNTYAESGTTKSYASSFEAIVAPGRTISQSADNVLVRIVVNGNSFNLTESQVLNTWGKVLKPGYHYVIAARVSRTHVSISAVVNDWAEGGSVSAGDAAVSFVNNMNTSGSIATALRAEGFELFYKESTLPNYGTSPITFSYDASTSTWKQSELLYWKDGQTRYHYRALSPASMSVSNGQTAISTGTTDYLYGTTPTFAWGADSIYEGTAVPLSTGTVSLKFYHALARITIKFKKINAADGGVDASNVSVVLKNAKSSAMLDLADGKLTDATGGSDYSIAVKDYTGDFMAVPQNLGAFTSATNDDLYLEITASGNTYTVYLKDIWDTETNKTTAIQNWDAGKHYIYTFSLYKKGANMTASLVEWEDGGTTSGNISL
jgi:hypothetical protein